MCLIHGADGAISENKRLRISKKIENNKKETEMKKLINVLAVALFVVFAGYNVYQSQKAEVMSDIAMENVEALAQMEYNPNSTITGECWDSYVVIEECYVECAICGIKWYPEEQKLYSVARNVSGKCPCGNTSWKNYN